MARVVVVGGGYGGVAVAAALDREADVVLVERKDAFVHNVATLRAAVDPDWTDRIFIPYDSLLTRGKVVQDVAIRVETGRVELSGGAALDADYIVLATGSVYPFPAKSPSDDSGTASRAYRDLQEAIKQAKHVLLLGAGPVGLELAGELTSRWPGRQVTIVDPAETILAGDFDDALRDELRTQLAGRGVRLLLGQELASLPDSAPGVRQTFHVRTSAGSDIAADLWLPCFGSRPVTDYLDGEIASALTTQNKLSVDEFLRVDGQTAVFAIGDIAGTAEANMASRAGKHAAVVAHNVGCLIAGGVPDLAYVPSPPVIVVPLGPDGGASQLPQGDRVVGAEKTAELKGKNLLVERYREQLGQDEA